MSGIISLLETLYHKNKLFFVIALIATLAFVAGCLAQGASPPPPSGPIGGGCG